MKLEEMILVIENRNGIETNYLSSFEDYLEVIQELFSDEGYDMAYAVEALFQTKEKKETWGEISVHSDYSYHAKFCSGIIELRGFLLEDDNHKNGKEPSYFDQDRCSVECHHVLAAYGLQTDGHSKFNSLHYERVEYTFQRGELLRNMNGSDYLVLAVWNQNNLLLYAQSDGQILVGAGTAYYKRMPKEGYLSKDSEILGVEWDHGTYLGQDITKIDLERLKREYGKSEEIQNLSDYREDIKRKFHKYESL
ncbi:MAG: hypothetical protein LBN31_14370, partial [Hungatella sp.]|nr:hypothetical protein [Hungatella sp.]